MHAANYDYSFEYNAENGKVHFYYLRLISIPTQVWASTKYIDIIKIHEENFMAIFTTLSVVIWFSTGTLGIWATLAYFCTMRVVIYDILSIVIISTLSTSILFCNLYYILLWISPRYVPYEYSKLCDINTHEKKLIHCMAVFTILYGNYYPPHGEFELICIGKFARRTWVNFTQKYGKNRQRCHLPCCMEIIAIFL